MNYFITRDKQMMGKYSELDIRYGLAEGKFHGSDIGWCEGMDEGRPLDELIAPGKKPLPPRKPKPAEEAPVSYAHQPKRTGSSRPRGTSALAVFALLMGILCLLTCGLLGLGALVTVIIGHLSLSRIRRSDGRLGGKGMAVSGLVMGYFSLLSLILMAVSLTLPAFTEVRGQIMKQFSSTVTSVENARSIVAACQQYALKHEGKFPENLEILLLENYIKDRSILWDPLLGEDSRSGYEYLGQGMKISDPEDAIVLRSKLYIKGMKIIARKNGTVSYTPER